MVFQEWTLEVRVEICHLLLFYSSGRNHENPGSLRLSAPKCSVLVWSFEPYMEFIFPPSCVLFKGWNHCFGAVTRNHTFNSSRFITMKMETFSW